jgi:hypothetical protein
VVKFNKVVALMVSFFLFLFGIDHCLYWFEQRFPETGRQGRIRKMLTPTRTRVKKLVKFAYISYFIALAAAILLYILEWAGLVSF